jgi:hypothetical protein
MMSRRRWLGGWGLLSGTYLALALVRGVLGGDLQGAGVYLVAATVTFAFAVAVLPFVVPRRDDGGDDDSSGGGWGRGGGEPEPPWWPEFERAFRRHARERSKPGGPARERTPA